MKFFGRMREDGSGEIQAVGHQWVHVSGAGSHGEMLLKMRNIALQTAQACFPGDDEFEFEMLEPGDDEPEPTAASNKGQVDPKLVTPERLQARRASGEHLCFFCTHDPICAIAGASRQHSQALVVIAGCASFSMVQT